MKGQRITIREVIQNQLVDTEVTLKGWVRSVRKSKAVSFIVLSDGSTQQTMQIVVSANLANFEEVSRLLTGSAISAKGPLVRSQGKEQGIEMQATSVEILGTIPEDYPLQKKATSLEFLREVAHLRGRTNTFGAVFRVRHALAYATHKFFNDRGFYYLHTPIVTASDCEGAGEMFRVTTLDLENPPRIPNKGIDFGKDYFGKGTYLTVSGQLEAECYALALGAVYTFGPTFRSENSNTSRHLSEFWMIEPEVAFNDLNDNANLATDYIKYLISYALETCPLELAFFEQHYSPGLIANLRHVAESPFIMVSYTEAVSILQKAATTAKFEFPVHWGTDLQTEHERFLAEVHFKAPVIVTDYPKEIKAFYMRQNDDGKTVRAMDILVPGIGELIGGSQREERYDLLLNRMREMKLDEKEYSWYLDLRRFGSVVHAGFGLGFERAIMYITGMSNIRDVIPFPRTPKNADF